MCSPVPIKIMGLLVAATLIGNRYLNVVKSSHWQGKKYIQTNHDNKQQRITVLRAQSTSSFGMSVKFGNDD